MTEKELLIDTVNIRDFCGPNNVTIERIKSLFPKVKIIARNEVFKVMGNKQDILYFEEKLIHFTQHFNTYQSISQQDMTDIIDQDTSYFSKHLCPPEDTILFGINGTPIKARTANQLKMVASAQKNDLTFAIGPAGSGKTYTAVALAVKALKNKEVKRIILTRPAVEAGENLGFLPGDLKEKLDPYLRPLYDALRDMIPTAKLAEYISDGTIEIAPLAFMRGRTLQDSFVILDEAQNTTDNQLKMFLTRMGKTATFFITGDLTQIDLPRNQQSGLKKAVQILANIEGIEIIYLNNKDIVRNKLVTKIIDAYHKHTEEN